MIPICVKGKGNISMQTEALVDSGAYSIFIHERIIKEYGFKKELLPHPYNVFNADNTPNKSGMITHRVMLNLKIGEHESNHSALITNLGTKDIILGMTYLRAHNPEIDWKNGTWSFTRCSTACGFNYIKNINPAEEEAEDLSIIREDEIPLGNVLCQRSTEDLTNQFINWIDYESEDSQTMVETIWKIAKEKKAMAGQQTENWQELIPTQYHDYGTVFSKKSSERIPMRKPYDHAIELKEGTELPSTLR